MESKNASPRKIIAIAVVGSVIASLAVTLGTVGYLSGSRPVEIIERMSGEGILAAAPGRQNLKLPRTDELVVSVVKRASPAVVSIVASKDVPVVEQYYVDPFGNDPFFRRFFGGGSGIQIPQLRQNGTERRDVSSGTGFIINASGLILTNKHVVADTAADYTVFMNDGSKIPAKVLARDPVQDLAVVRIERSGLPTLPVGDSDAIEPGQTAIAIGNALGEFQNTVSVGVVSGLHRSIVASGQGVSEQLGELIQTDAAINPGNSGGPLLNLNGEVIGINTAVAEGAQSIGFAIPINGAKRDIASVTAVGRIIYPFLGVRYQIVTPSVARERKLGVEYGALIVAGDGEPGVVNASPADRAGLREGDVILEFNGQKIDAKHTLSQLLGERQVGETVRMKVLRKGQTLNLEAALAERKGA